MKDKPADKDVDRMRELLARTPPADPALAGRAEAVVQRARRDRRRRGVIGGVAVALFAAAVIVTPHFLKTSPTTNEATDPSNGAEVTQTGLDPSTTNPCPPEPIDISEAGSVASLPTGAESVRVCPAVWPHIQGSASKQDLLSSWVAPPDALVESPDKFIDAVNAAPTWDPDTCAAADWVNDPFAVVVTYADGAVVFGAQAPICNAVKIGGREIGSDSVVSSFVEAVKAQDSSSVDPTQDQPTCGSVDEQKKSTFEADQIAGPTVAGVVCYAVDPNGGREYADDEAVLNKDQIAVLEADVKAHPDTSAGMCIDTGPVRAIRFVDERGNVTAWVDDHCTGDFFSPVGGWSPSAEAEQIIADALGGRVD